jgi:hypothetical protein
VVGADIVARPSEAAAAMAMKLFFIVRVSLGDNGRPPPTPYEWVPVPWSGWAAISPTNLTEM